MYTDKVTGEHIQIVREEADYYVLSNKASIKKNIFSNKYEESIDPNAFLNPQLGSSADPLVNLANQIKSMDTAKMTSENDTNTRVKYKPAQVLSDDSRTEKKVLSPQIEDTEGIVLSDQQRKMVLETWMRNNPNSPVPETVNFKENAKGEIEYEIVKGQAVPIERDEVQRIDPTADPLLTDNRQAAPQGQHHTQQVTQDPLQVLFKMFKSNHPVTITFSIEEMIPKPTFMSEIMDNVNVDVVDYYAKIILDKFLKDPTVIKNEIYAQLKDVIDKEMKGGAIVLKKTKKKLPPKPRKKQSQDG